MRQTVMMRWIETADAQFACEHATVMIVKRKASSSFPVVYATPIAAVVAILLLALGL